MGKVQPCPLKTPDYLGSRMYSAKRYDEAAALFEEAASLKPSASLEHFKWAWALKMSGKTEESVEMFRQAIRFNEEDGELDDAGENPLGALANALEALNRR